MAANDTEKKEDLPKPPRPQTPRSVLIYAVFCLVVASAMAVANRRGWFPTYGIFSGENSMHSHYRPIYYGGYGIHGK